MDHRKKLPAAVQLLAEAAQAARHLDLTWERIRAALPAEGGIPLPALAARLGVDLDRADQRLALLALLHHDTEISREREPGGRVVYRQRGEWERRRPR